ncbi:MAG: hypothetical protein IT269_11100 [Saprospiraceae bacterium]|nr:hypothetical protein [Saprospiraceae bacterium]
MKFSLLTVLCFLMFLPLFAQKATVLHCSGRVNYYAASGASPKKLYPGMELSPTGRLRCNKGASAKLLYNKKSFLVKSTQFQDVAELLQVNDNSSSLGFGGRFLNFLTESIHESESTDKLQENHRRYMNKAGAAIKGYSSKEYTITTDLLTSGVLPAESVRFTWGKLPGASPYKFALMDESGNVYAQIQARDTFITLDLSELGIKRGPVYQWQVCQDEQINCSAPMTFELDPASHAKALDAIEKSADYQSASDAEKQLMLAYQLEQNRAYYQANRYYQRLLKKEPENQLYRRLYSAFLMRTNRLNESLSLQRGG